MRKSSNTRWSRCPRDLNRRLHPLPPSAHPVPEQRLEVKTVEPDGTEGVVENGQQVIKAEKRWESTTKYLEESDVDKSFGAAKYSSGKSEEDKLKITTNDPEESDVEESIDDTHKSSEKSEEEENVDNNGEDQLYLKLLIGIAIQLLALCLLR
jgi:hypothetical protein